jgi:glycosyltransferase involved in cell wall biosynthesis
MRVHGKGASEKMKGWLAKSPSFEEVAAEVSDRRERRGKAAIIIPTYRDSATLTEHIRKLGNQTFQDFDLIIVYGKDDEFLDVPALHIREAGDNGCTAAYYAGEKKALEEGYETIILADDDAQPVSDDLLEKLARGVENGAELAYPKVSYPPCIGPEHGRIIHHYGCMRASVLRESGLTFVPFISGGEDIELQERFVQRGHRMANVEALAEHPKRPPLQIEEGSKIHHYQRGHLMSHLIHNRIYGAWRFALFNSMVGIGFLLLGKRLGRKFLSAMWSGSGMVFFREKQGKVLPPEPSDIGGGYIEIGLGSKIPVPWDYLEKDSSFKRRIGWFATYISNLPKFFNRKVLIVDRNRITPDMPIMLISRKSALRYMGKEYVVSNDAGLPAIILRSAAFALAAPAAMVWAGLLVCRGIALKRMKKIRTTGYGVRF